MDILCDWCGINSATKKSPCRCKNPKAVLDVCEECFPKAQQEVQCDQCCDEF
jgi:hypothetical protein